MARVAAVPRQPTHLAGERSSRRSETRPLRLTWRAVEELCGRKGTRQASCQSLIVIQVQLMEYSMAQRREDDAGGEDQQQSRVEREETRKKLG